MCMPSPSERHDKVTAVTDAGHPARDTHFMWLELTSSCQLECSHCYADSGPGRGHGVLSFDQWAQALTAAAEAGVQQVQFIGGEPTSHPALPRLIHHARQVGLRVEVFSNLFSIRERVWEALTQPGVTLATSYYSSDAMAHDRITHRAGSYHRTRTNIAEAVRRGIPLRVGLIRLSEEQDIGAAVEELVSIGVPRDTIGFDDLRGVGRGRDSEACTTEGELCGRCADGVLAVMPDGTVQPCVFSRDARFKVGDLTTDNLASVVEGERLREMRERLATAFVQRGLPGVDCPPADPADPQGCGPACSPSCMPLGNCNPIVNPPPCLPIAGHPPGPEPTPRPPGPVCGPYPG
jgi:MoaA/NifB/PqqE/SkfB family radical SAM enzyme